MWIQDLIKTIPTWVFILLFLAAFGFIVYAFRQKPKQQDSDKETPVDDGSKYDSS